MRICFDIVKFKEYAKPYVVKDLPKKVLQVGIGIMIGMAFNSIDRWMHPVKYAIKGAIPLVNPLQSGVTVGIFVTVDYLAKKYFKSNTQSSYYPLLRLGISAFIAGSAAEVSMRISTELAVSIIAASIFAKTYLLSMSKKHDKVTYEELVDTILKQATDPSPTAQEWAKKEISPETEAS